MIHQLETLYTLCLLKSNDSNLIEFCSLNVAPLTYISIKGLDIAATPLSFCIKANFWKDNSCTLTCAKIHVGWTKLVIPGYTNLVSNHFHAREYHVIHYGSPGFSAVGAALSHGHLFVPLARTLSHMLGISVVTGETPVS